MTWPSWECKVDSCASKNPNVFSKYWIETQPNLVAAWLFSSEFSGSKSLTGAVQACHYFLVAFFRVKFLSVAYRTVANLARVRMSVHC